MLANIEELGEEMTTTQLTNLLNWYPHNSTLQRLGYLLEWLNIDHELLTILDLHLAEQGRLWPTLLAPRSNEKPGPTANNRWGIDANIKLENDL